MNIQDLLKDFSVEYWERGENVGKGWINVQCPFCDDDKNHCGIQLKNLNVRCWKCGKHTIFELLRIYADSSISQSELFKMIKGLDIEEEIITPIIREEKTNPANRKILPAEASDKFPKFYLEYLKNRGFDPDRLIKKYRLKAVHTIGRYKFRIIIPIFMNGKIVSYTSRAVLKDMEPPYLHPTKEEPAISPKKLIYNYDTIKEGGDAFAVEGPFDSWGIGDGAGALFGVKFTVDQIKLLMRKKIRNLYILFDNDKTGRKEAERCYHVTSPLIKNVEILTLESIHDPGELRISQAKIIKEQVDFNKGI